MFKKNLADEQDRVRRKVVTDVRRAFCILFSGAVFLLNGCLTLPPLPQVNLSEPGWTVRQGQAVWKPNRQAPEIAGEILVATRDDGRAFVQFTKTPLPFAVAQLTPTSWQIEIPMQNRRFAGRGAPPSRLIWLRLPGCLSGNAPPKPWSWQILSGDRWRLENGKTGEVLEGYFTS